MPSPAPRRPTRTTTAWPVAASRYTLGMRLGGALDGTSTMWSAQCAAGTAALKRVDLDKHRSLESLQREVAAHRGLAHERLVRWHAAFVSGAELWLVMQLHSAGSCADIMRWAHPQGFEEQHALTILREVCRGLEYLHGAGLLHRNIKASNVMVDAGGAVRLGDFAFSGSLIEGGVRLRRASAFVGSPCWMAPEVLEQEKGYDASADIWSLGITAIELSSGAPPHSGLQPMQVMLLVLQGEPPSAPSGVSRGFRELVGSCLCREPRRRAGVSALLRSKAFGVLKEGGAEKQVGWPKLVASLPPLAEQHRALQAKAAAEDIMHAAGREKSEREREEAARKERERKRERGERKERERVAAERASAEADQAARDRSPQAAGEARGEEEERLRPWAQGGSWLRVPPSRSSDGLIRLPAGRRGARPAVSSSPSTPGDAAASSPSIPASSSQGGELDSASKGWGKDSVGEAWDFDDDDDDAIGRLAVRLVARAVAKGAAEAEAELAAEAAAAAAAPAAAAGERRAACSSLPVPQRPQQQRPPLQPAAAGPPPARGKRLLVRQGSDGVRREEETSSSTGSLPSLPPLASPPHQHANPNPSPALDPADPAGALRSVSRLLSTAGDELQGLREHGHALLGAAAAVEWPASHGPAVMLEACLAMRQQLATQNQMLRAHNAALRGCLGPPTAQAASGGPPPTPQPPPNALPAASGASTRPPPPAHAAVVGLADGGTVACGAAADAAGSRAGRVPPMEV